jgi:hypothetical protein
MNKPIDLNKLREANEEHERQPSLKGREIAPLAGRGIISPFSSMHDFESVQRMAQCLCTSSLVPKDFQGQDKLGNCLLALEIAQRASMPIMLVLQNLNVIHGKTSWSSAYIISCINMSGRFVDPLEFHQVGEKGKDSWGLYASAVTHSGKLIKGPVVTIGMAKDEGWYSKKGSKWKTIPALMLRYRAAAWFGRTVCPELLMGLSATDEVIDGGVIDITPDVVEAPKPPKKTRKAKKEPEVIESTAEVVESEATEPEQQVDPEAQDVLDQLKEFGYYYSAAIDTFINKHGDEYDEEVHAKDSEGLPIVNMDGSFRARRGARVTDEPAAKSESVTDDGEDEGFDLE